MGHFAKSTLRTSAVAGLAIALASPFARPADALPRAPPQVTRRPQGSPSRWYINSPRALQTTPKYLALSKDGNLYGATSAVGLVERHGLPAERRYGLYHARNA